MDLLVHGALLGSRDVLGEQVRLRAGRAHAAGHVHGSLEGIVLPAENVVCVLAVPGVVPEAEVEGLRAVCGPQRLVVELSRVPHHLEHELRDVDGMCGRTGRRLANEVDWATRGIRNVIL